MAKVIKQVERLTRVFICLPGQANDESAKGKPVMSIQNFHSLYNYISPLMSFIRIGLPFHKCIEELGTASLESNDRIRDSMIVIGRIFMSHVRVRHDLR